MIVISLAWNLISALIFFVRLWRLWGIIGRFDVISHPLCALSIEYLLAVVFVSLTFRVLQNVTRPERRKARVRETLVCTVTFLALVNLVNSVIRSYPPDW